MTGGRFHDSAGQPTAANPPTISDELAARRLSAAIHDTRFERFLWRLSRVLWWPGDKVDAMRCRRQWRRAQLDHNARRRP